MRLPHHPSPCQVCHEEMLLRVAREQAALAAAAAAGTLLGGFHGRLHSVARLAAQQAQHGTAVNAALMEVCSLVSLLIELQSTRRLCLYAAHAPLGKQTLS